jgi:hypothetical protein
MKKKIMDFFFCKELEGIATEEDVFNILNEYVQCIGLSWLLCVGICTDGASSAVGSFLWDLCHVPR